MPCYIVIRNGSNFHIGTKFVGDSYTGLKEAEFRDEDGNGEVRLRPKFGKIILPFHVLAPFLMEMDFEKTQR
jgi:hypothetical protein